MRPARWRKVYTGLSFVKQWSTDPNVFIWACVCKCVCVHTYPKWLCEHVEKYGKTWSSLTGIIEDEAEVRCDSRGRRVTKKGKEILNEWIMPCIYYEYVNEWIIDWNGRSDRSLFWVQWTRVQPGVEHGTNSLPMNLKVFAGVQGLTYDLGQVQALSRSWRKAKAHKHLSVTNRSQCCMTADSVCIGIILD